MSRVIWRIKQSCCYRAAICRRVNQADVKNPEETSRTKNRHKKQRLRLRRNNWSEPSRRQKPRRDFENEEPTQEKKDWDREGTIGKVRENWNSEIHFWLQQHDFETEEFILIATRRRLKAYIPILNLLKSRPKKREKTPPENKYSI